MQDETHTSLHLPSDESPVLDYALTYLNLGWSVIPILKDDNGQWKKPAFPWKAFQIRLPTKDQLLEWWKQWPEARVGIITGKLSGLVVVDIDPRHGGSTSGIYLPHTLISQTGGGGWHYLYAYPKDLVVKNSTGIYPGVDVRGEGGFIVAPPSIHASGKSYSWAEDFDASSLTECPSWLLTSNQGGSPVSVRDLFSGVPEGGRNTAAARMAGILFSFMKIGRLDDITWEMLKEWNSQNQPPLPEGELRLVFLSIHRLESDKQNSVKNEKRLDIVSVEELLEKKIPPPMWMLNRMVPSTGLVAVSGKPESFKTWFVTWMAWRIASEKPLFNQKEGESATYLEELGDKHAGKVNILFIEEENTESVTQGRLRLFALPVPPKETFYLLINAGFKFSDEEMRNELKLKISALKIQLLIIDPFSSVMGFEDENNNAQVSELMDVLRHEFIEELGICIVFIHHPAKGAENTKSLRGAGDILGKCDVHLNLEVEDPIEKIVKVTYEKLRIEDRRLVHDFRMRMTKNVFEKELQFVYEGIAKAKSEEARTELTNRLLETMEAGESYTKTELGELINKKRTDSQFESIFTQLIKDKAIYKSAAGVGRYPKFCKK